MFDDALLKFCGTLITVGDYRSLAGPQLGLLGQDYP
jgi:hypothetical protein